MRILPGERCRCRARQALRTLRARHYTIPLWLETYLTLGHWVEQSLDNGTVDVGGSGNRHTGIDKLRHVEVRCCHDAVAHATEAHLVGVLENRSVKRMIPEGGDLLGGVVEAEQRHLAVIDVTLLEGL